MTEAEDQFWQAVFVASICGAAVSVWNEHRRVVEQARRIADCAVEEMRKANPDNDMKRSGT